MSYIFHPVILYYLTVLNIIDFDPYVVIVVMIKRRENTLEV